MVSKTRYMIISSCTAGKDDSIPLPKGVITINPREYITEGSLRTQFLKTRSEIFLDPKSKIGEKNTLAYNLYVRKGRAYKILYQKYYEQTLEALKRHDFEWFFLSGGYGLVHALEESHRYQATFSRGTAYQNDIPFTGTIWKKVLPRVIDSVIDRYRPDTVLVFGSRDYTSFVEATSSYRKERRLFEVTESYGSSGPIELSPKIARAIQSIIL